jgi:septum formation protein
MNDPAPLILASQSPRRRYLLQRAGLVFRVVPSRVDESAVEETEPAALVRLLAEKKALEVSDRHPDCWVIGADTVVRIDERILGKPGSDAEARRMLERLSGRTHEVFTGYCIVHRNRERRISDTVVTDVTFKRLSEKEIDWYIHTGEPFDKAGAYAIQGLGTFLVRSIHGSYTNVVGLPVSEVLEVLIREGVMDLDARPDHPHVVGER